MTFNGHYAVPPTGFYTQSSPVPPFNPASFPYGIPPPIPPPPGNIQRFEANAQVPAPPIPYWNPEILKQLSQLPIPPPPPLPIPPAIGTPPFIRPLANTPQFQFQNTNNDRIDEIREKAKEAIASLNPHVRYQDFLEEGISQSVLDKLYAELGIDKDQHVRSSVAKSETGSTVKPYTEPVAEISNEPIVEPVIDSGLERKDRIARLLAAKKGRINTGTNSPAQASTPEVLPHISDVNSVVNSEKAPSPVPDKTAETENGTPVVEDTAVSTATSVTTPTSNRQTATLANMSSSAFSIPGLSMTADDHNDLGATQTRPKVNTHKLNARMAALKADMLRKKTLQDGMPVLNAEVEKTRDRLTEQRNKLAVIREDILAKEHRLSEAREEEARILKEIEHLENQLVEGENGQKQFNRELTQLNDQITEQEKEAINSVSVSSALESFQSTEQSSTTPASKAALIDYDNDKADVGISEDVFSSQSSGSATETATHTSRDDIIMGEADSEQAENIEIDASYETQSTHLTTTATPSNMPSVHEDDDGDDDEQMSIDDVSDAESGGSASMSDSGSDYEPAVDQFDDQTQSVNGGDNAGDDDDYDPQTSHILPDPSRTEVENDDYEPSERLNSIHLEKVQNGVVDDANATQIDSRPELGPATNQSPAEATPAEEVPATSTFPTRHSSIDRVVIATKPDDEILTKQRNLPGAKSVYEEIAPLDNKPESNRSFAPYQSPLSMLKSFRFHPQFTELVPNGYRSLTYSNQVDVNRPLCATELEGNMCTDTECEDQHFGGMSLSDDKILVQMSSAFDIKDKAQRDAYLIGLKKVIADLRERGVKEFSEVAGALSKYRREWQSSQDGIVV